MHSNSHLMFTLVGRFKWVNMGWGVIECYESQVHNTGPQGPKGPPGEPGPAFMDIFHNNPKTDHDESTIQKESVLFKNTPPFPSSSIPLDEAFRSQEAADDYEDEDEYANINLFRNNNIEPSNIDQLNITQAETHSNKPKLNFNPNKKK